MSSHPVFSDFYLRCTILTFSNSNNSTTQCPGIDCITVICEYAHREAIFCEFRDTLDVIDEMDTSSAHKQDSYQ